MVLTVVLLCSLLRGAKLQECKVRRCCTLSWAQASGGEPGCMYWQAVLAPPVIKGEEETSLHACNGSCLWPS